jgi:hypothetical protein
MIDWLLSCTASVNHPHPCCCCAPAIKFPVQLEKAWLLASFLGFTLDVFVYHTFSLFVRSVMKLLVRPTSHNASNLLHACNVEEGPPVVE